MADIAGRIDRRVAPLQPAEAPPGPGTPLAQAESLLAKGRTAHERRDFGLAEDLYREAMTASRAPPATMLKTPMARARYNMAVLHRDQGRMKEAADTMSALRRTPDGLLNPDAEVHANYADMRIRQAERLAVSGFGPERPVMSGGAVVYQPQILEALREGARASLDLAAVLSDQGVRAALGEARVAQLAPIAKTGLLRSRDLYRQQLAAIQQANRTGRVEDDRAWVQWFQAGLRDLDDLGLR